MAPEMIRDQDVDGRTGIYAVGCVAYWLLTFESQSLTEMTRGLANCRMSGPRSAARERPAPLTATDSI